MRSNYCNHCAIISPSWQLSYTTFGITSLLSAVSIFLAIYSYQVSVASTAGDNKDLDSLGLVQRITRYPLLIRQILQYTQHGNDRVLIEKVLSAVGSTFE